MTQSLPFSSTIYPSRPVAGAIPAEHWADLLYAVACGLIFTGLRIDLQDYIPQVSLRLYPSIPFMALAIGLQFFGLVRGRFMLRMWSLPLLAMAAVHVLSAMRLGLGNGLRELAQAALIFLFITAFGARYSKVSIRRFFIFFAPIALVIMAFNIGWHVTHGYYFQWKRLDSPKALFDLMPLMIAGFFISRPRINVTAAVVVMAAAAVIILLSGERKAYMSMVVALALMLNPKRVSSYFAPLALGVLVYVVAQLSGSAYVHRQLQTVLALAGIGELPDTISDSMRLWQLHLSMILFKSHPWLGVGTNGYMLYSSTEYASADYSYIGIHGEFLRILVEDGLVGLAVYLVFLGSILWRMVRKIVDETGMSKEARIGLIWFFTILAYTSFEASNLIMVLQYSLAYLPILNLSGRDLEDSAGAAEPVTQTAT